jgi:predicted TIM-barrel fold metal-dependent hydrolase
VDWQNTRFAVGNDYVADIAAKHEKVLFGASVHPYRRDGVRELERLLGRGACLVKWIPSAQGIDPADPLCTPFFEALAHYRVPLLTHVGPEHTVPGARARLNDPRRLQRALDCGVTVIGAHCGTRLYLHERSAFGPWRRMALEHERFYGDMSAFGLPLHAGPLATIRRTHGLLAKVVYGSDFPALTFPLAHLRGLGLGKALRLRQHPNPFDKAYLVLRDQGLPEEVFQRAFSLLRLPASTEKGATACVPGDSPGR